jgi:predicted dehydrogenase
VPRSGTAGEIRVGLVGYGLAGSVFHAPLIAATPGMRVTAIVTSDIERRGQAHREHPDVLVADDADRLLERAEELDLVVIASPNRTHVPIARSALAAGLAVVVDKPFAPHAADARALVEDARARKLMLTVYQNRRGDGDFLTLRRLIAEDALGRVWRFESRFERWRPVPKGGWRERAAPDEAGGTLYDLGSHLIDQALLLFGPVTHVYAELDRRRQGAEVDDDAFVALVHASGTHAQLWMNAIAAQPGPRFRVLGSTAAYTKHGMDVQEEMLRAGARPGQPGFGVEPEARWGALGVLDELRKVPTEPGQYGRFYPAVAAAIRDGAPPPVDPMESVAGLEIIEAARRSALERRVIALGA